jgi:hypothetical protein
VDLERYMPRPNGGIGLGVELQLNRMRVEIAAEVPFLFEREVTGLGSRRICGSAESYIEGNHEHGVRPRSAIAEAGIP